jgi:hypothetical protein
MKFIGFREHSNLFKEAFKIIYDSQYKNKKNFLKNIKKIITFKADELNNLQVKIMNKKNKLFHKLNNTNSILEDNLYYFIQTINSFLDKKEAISNYCNKQFVVKKKSDIFNKKYYNELKNQFENCYNKYIFENLEKICEISDLFLLNRLYTDFIFNILFNLHLDKNISIEYFENNKYIEIFAQKTKIILSIVSNFNGITNIDNELFQSNIFSEFIINILEIYINNNEKNCITLIENLFLNIKEINTKLFNNELFLLFIPKILKSINNLELDFNKKNIIINNFFVNIRRLFFYLDFLDIKKNIQFNIIARINKNIASLELKKSNTVFHEISFDSNDILFYLLEKNKKYEFLFNIKIYLYDNVHDEHLKELINFDKFHLQKFLNEKLIIDNDKFFLNTQNLYDLLIKKNILLCSNNSLNQYEKDCKNYFFQFKSVDNFTKNNIILDS